MSNRFAIVRSFRPVFVLDVLSEAGFHRAMLWRSSRRSAFCSAVAALLSFLFFLEKYAHAAEPAANDRLTIAGVEGSVDVSTPGAGQISGVTNGLAVSFPCTIRIQPH